MAKRQNSNDMKRGTLYNEQIRQALISLTEFVNTPKKMKKTAKKIEWWTQESNAPATTTIFKTNFCSLERPPKENEIYKMEGECNFIVGYGHAPKNKNIDFEE